jgi:hypothetical protein
MGIALAIGGFTHPFIPGHVAQGIGLAVAAAGFAGATVTLLRIPTTSSTATHRAPAVTALLLVSACGSLVLFSRPCWS